MSNVLCRVINVGQDNIYNFTIGIGNFVGSVENATTLFFFL